MTVKVPDLPRGAIRVVVELPNRARLDSILLENSKREDAPDGLKGISRRSLKHLFHEKRIQIKGQPALPSSLLASGVTYIDILEAPLLGSTK